MALADYPVGPDAAYDSVENGQLLLPYEAVAEAEDPDRDLAEFLHATYRAAADLGGWTGRAWRTTRTGGRSIDQVA